MVVRWTAALTLVAGSLAAQGAGFVVEDIQPPAGVLLEVGGMDFRPDGSLVLCNRRGDVWICDAEGKSWRQFADGLQEPLGLLVGSKPGEVFVLQRDELTRLVDENGDDRADLYQTWARGWGYTGNYHEYAFGLARDAAGNMYGALGLGFFPQHAPFKPRWCARGNVKWRGWLFKITPQREFVPLAPGCREPNSVAVSPDDEVFVTDNQGSYVPAGVLNHAQPGDFLGHPDGLLDDARHPEAATYSVDKLNSLRKRPAAYLPYPEMGRSCTKPCWDTTGGKFGPFAGHILIGDINKPAINRVTLEKIDGQYQGACYPFLERGKLGGGVNRLRFDARGRLWVGRTGRGWASGAGMQRITWNGTIAPSLAEVRLADGGFTLRFTKPVDAKTAGDPGSYKVRHWRYEYTHKYGAGRLDKKDDSVATAELSGDRLTVELRLAEPLIADRVYAVECGAVLAEGGGKLERATAFYTLNRLPTQ